MSLVSGSVEGLPRLEVGELVNSAIDWADDTFGVVFDLVSDVLTATWELITAGLLAVPTLLMVAVFALLALLLRSWQFAVATVVGLLLVVSMETWESAMGTLAFVLIATLIAIVISVPLGILAARNNAVSAALRPVLDFMQTMPAFVYLVPAVVIFSIGLVPGLISTIIFALPPGVRLTELGIRQVDAETVEAGRAFGATPRQILRGIQVPLATPTIMAGINQVIMLALSMSVIAGIIGARGLGQDVVESISRLDVPQGIEAGLAVVILAIYLDRITGALGQSDQSAGALRHRLRRAQAATPESSGTSETVDAPLPPEAAAGRRTTAF